MSHSYSLGRVQRRKPISILHGCTRKGISFYYDDYDHDGLGWAKYGTSHSILLPVLWLKNDHFQPPDAEVIFSLNCIMIICLFLRVRCVCVGRGVGGGEEGKGEMGKLYFTPNLKFWTRPAFQKMILSILQSVLWRPGNKKKQYVCFFLLPY